MQPIDVDPHRGSGEDAVKLQLDALANGECNHVAFLDAMKERFRSEPDENWEVLSLLDQYYRRGKIPLDVFRAIKNGFAEYILGPHVAMPTLHKVAIPAPAPPPAAAGAPVMPAAAPGAPPMPAAAPPTMAAVAALAAAQPLAAAPTLVHAPTLAPAPAVLTPASTYTGIPTQAAIAAGKASAAPVREVRVGDVLRDRYRVEAILARGGSGTVFEVSDANRLNLPPAGKRLAVKVPRIPDPRGNSASQLRHEFHQLQHLSHPNIVRAFDFDRDGPVSFLTMELLRGVHLSQVVEAKHGRALPRAYALAIIRDLGAATAYAHSRGVVHGDINPQNVFITTAGKVRLLGFGAAHKLSAAVPTPEFERASAASDTHRFASCEVFEGNRPDTRDDIYSLSCVAYLLLKGTHPYAGSTSIEARASHLRPSRPAGLTYQQWRMLRAGLRTDARKRPGSAQEWIEAMQLRGAVRVPAANELIEAPGDKPRSFHFLAAAAAIVALIGAGYWFSIAGDSPPLPPLTGEPVSEDRTPPPSSAPLAPPTAVTAPRPAPTPAPPAVPATRPAAAQTPQTVARPTPAPAASGPARIEMASDTLDVLPTDTAVHVTVHRKGNLHGATSFTWWTESGTAKPGTDFSPVLPHIAQLQDGESSTVLTVPLLSTVRAQPKGFYVGIESTEGGAQVGARALTQITLPPTN
jgi:serine/threonine protein kinase